MALTAILFVSAFVLASGFPTDPIIRKLDETRYQYITGPDGTAHLVDLWVKASDVAESARYAPDTENTYHLFTRLNPTVSQPMLISSSGIIGGANYDPQRRTIVLIHGWLDTVTSDHNTALTPAFLTAEDVNVIVVDWSFGAGTVNYATAVINTPTSGESVARFINSLNHFTGSTPASFHIVGHHLGGHQAGIVGRNLYGEAAYITALDPAFPGWITNEHCFKSTDGGYTEVIHTNAGHLGYIAPLGHVDFYPNGGVDMPGCISQECDQARSFHYMAESVTTGGFTGRRCASYPSAMLGQCYLFGTLQMGGLVPKTGSTGIYYLVTNWRSPFSRG